MKKEQADRIMRQADQVYLFVLEAVYPGIKPKEKKAIEKRWAVTEMRRKIKEICRRVPDDRAPVLLRQIEAAPVNLRRAVRDWLKECTDGFGGATPLLPDNLRREAVIKVRGLQETGTKRSKAVEEIAGLYGMEPKQLEGILRHKSRYKDTP
jgi:hypothetical protein